MPLVTKRKRELWQKLRWVPCTTNGSFLLYRRFWGRLEISDGNQFYSVTDTFSKISHAHTVVWECCKDDRQSQWGMAKFDPQPTLNPWTDRHQIWNTWLCRGYLLRKNLGSIRPHIYILAPIYPKYIPKTFECLLHFFQFFRAPTEKAVGPIFALNTSYDVVLRKEVPFGVRKINFKIWPIYSKNSKNL